MTRPKKPGPPELVPEPFLLYNHHKMVNNQYTYEGCYGGKTGYTDKAGNTLVTYAKRGNMDLVCVLMACPSGDDYVYKDTQVVLDYCFENYDRLTDEYQQAQELLDYPKLALTTGPIRKSHPCLLRKATILIWPHPWRSTIHIYITGAPRKL